MSDGRDLVTPEVRRFVILRDKRECMAPVLDFNAGPCRDKWGQVVTVLREEHLTLDHVKDKPKFGDRVEKRGAERKHRYRAPSTPEHLICLCWGHHLGGWATSHRTVIRDYLATFTSSSSSGGDP